MHQTFLASYRAPYSADRPILTLPLLRLFALVVQVVGPVVGLAVVVALPLTSLNGPIRWLLTTLTSLAWFLYPVLSACPLNKPPFVVSRIPSGLVCVLVFSATIAGITASLVTPLFVSPVAVIIAPTAT